MNFHEKKPPNENEKYNSASHVDDADIFMFVMLAKEVNVPHVRHPAIYSLSFKLSANKELCTDVLPVEQICVANRKSLKACVQGALSCIHDTLCAFDLHNAALSDT